MSLVCIKYVIIDLKNLFFLGMSNVKVIQGIIRPRIILFKDTLSKKIRNLDRNFPLRSKSMGTRVTIWGFYNSAEIFVSSQFLLY